MKISKTGKRTLFLALLAAVSFVYSAIVHFGIEPQRMVSFFLNSLILLGGCLIVATILVSVLVVIKKWRQ